MKVKCPTCGEVGTDVEPIPEEFRGPSWKPLKGEDQYAFEVYGHEGGRAVRKCLNCGAGVYVKLLPPRYQAIPPARWEQMQEYFDEQMAESEERRRKAFEQLERERVAREAAADPDFQPTVEALLERLNELWGSAANPLMREGSDSPPGDLERAIIKQVVREASLTHVMEAMDRDAEPDEARMNRETNVLMLLAAGGYLWRTAEREAIANGPPLREAEFAVQWMKENPSADDNERFEKLARAMFWMLESLSSLAFPPEVAPVNAEATLDFGFEAVAEFACEQEGVHPAELLVGEEGMRSAFKAGVALREVEPYFAT